MSEIDDRLDRLESKLDQQQQRIDDQQATIEDQQDTIESQQSTIEEQREQIADLKDDDSTAATEAESTTLNRRNALKAGGLLALLFGSAGTASADSQGQVGTSSDPLKALYTDELYGNSGTVTVQDDLDLNGNNLTSTSAGTDFLVDIDSMGSGDEEDFALEIEDASGNEPTVRWRREPNSANAFRVVADDGTTTRTRLRLDDDGTLGVHGDITNSEAFTIETTSTGNLTLNAADNVALGSTLDTNGNDLEDSGTTVWDTAKSYVPRGSQQMPENVIVVAKSGGDYTTVSNALGSISDNSASNPYVIKVEPGVYDEKIQLKSHVDIVGSGPNATRIETTQNLVSDATLQPNGATNVEVRNMTVEGNGAAVNQASGSDVILRRLRLRQTGTDISRVVSHGANGTLTLRDCIVRTTRSGSDGIIAYEGTVEIVGCRIDAKDNAIVLSDTSGPTVNIRRSFLDGDDNAITTDTGSTIRAAHSHLKGGIAGTLDGKFSVHNGYSGI